MIPLGLRALLVAAAAFAWAAPAQAGWDDPVGKKKPVLVIPIRYADSSGTCSPSACPSSFYGSTFAAAAGSINPPYRTAALWGTFLNTTVDDLLLEDSYGAASFDFEPLVNPGAKSGWWDAGRSIESYGRLASLIFPVDTTTGLPAPLDDFVKRLPCSTFTSGGGVHRLLVIDNLAIGGGLRGRQVITLQCGTTWEVDWSWVHQSGNEAGFLQGAERALGLSLGMRDVGRPCPTYPGRATCFERWDSVAGTGNGEYGGLQRTTLGWVPPASVKTVPLPAKSATLDLQPLNAAPSSSVPTIVRLPVVSGPMFKGYLLECRRGPHVEKEGVVVTWVDDIGGQAWIASRSPLTLDTAALAPGEKLVDPKNDVEIQATAGTGSRCRASVSEAPALYPGVVIRIPVDTFDFLSPDVGLGMPGDLLQSPWDGHLNPLWFTVHNGGSGPAQGAHAVVSITDPATVAVACGSPAEGDPQSVTLPSIPAGGSRTTTLAWLAGKRSGRPIRIAVHLEGGQGDRAGGGFASGAYAVQAHAPGETKPVATAFAIEASPRCGGPAVFSATPLRVPAGWRARVTPRLVRLAPGKARMLSVLVLAPRTARAGAAARIRVAVTASVAGRQQRARRLLQQAPAGGFVLFARVVRPGSATLTCPTQGQAGSRVSLTGAASGAGPVLVEIRNAQGTPVVHEVQAGADGAFTDSLVPSSTGTWNAQARFQGNGPQGPAESLRCTFAVAAPMPAQLPDLVVSAVQKDGFTVTNRGGGPAVAFKVGVQQTQGTTSFDVGGLAAGASVSRSFACRQGPVAVTADAGAEVAEADEDNNTATLIVQGC